MTADQRKTILVGVTGCIAAYKSAEIVRGFQKAGYRVKVVMTEHSCEFIGPTTFRALTHEPVAVGLFDEPGDPIHHVSLAQECDAFVIAPCTANVAAKIACGIADDLLTTTALATTAPLIIAPAMNVHMYEAAATQENFAVLARRGVKFVDAGEGYLACGDVGRGRMADPDDIVAQAIAVLDRPRDLAGLRVFVTAGPTVEPIDPVRFVSNRSSGKMGYAIAQAAKERGAEVVIASGPVSIDPPAGVKVIRIETARELLEASREPFAASDISVFTAAVADMRPSSPSKRKLKKGADSAALETIRLVENPDVLAQLASGKRADQVVIGFAAETDDIVNAAREKLDSKHADLIVANEVGRGKAFGADDNQVTFVSRESCDALPLSSKRAVADALLDRARALLELKCPSEHEER